MDQLAQTIASGITIGVVFALVGVGFALIFNSSDVINFAQGEFVLLGGFGYVAFNNLTGNVVVALLLALVTPMLFGAATYLGLIAPMRRASVLRIVMLTLGLSVLVKGVALVAAGPNPYGAPPLSGSRPLRVLGADVTSQSLWMALALVVVGMLLWAFFTRSNVGLKMLACAIDRRAAALCGIDSKKMVLLSWMGSALLAALAGALLTPQANVTYDQGFAMSLNGFAAAALGGVGRIGGAILGGLLIGFANAFSAGYLPHALSAYHNVVGLVLLVVVLMIRPNGLFEGRAESRHTAELG